MAKLEVLLAGATGYIGGTILTTILKSKNDLLEYSNLSLLVRGEDKARILNEEGLTTVLFEDLKDTEEVASIASNYDLIINATPGGSVDSAVAFIKGLGNRKQATGKNVYYIHTSGTSNIASLSPSVPTLTSPSPTLYSHLQRLNAETPYAQRTTDIAVIATGLSADVQTYILMPPTIYGTGTGLFNRTTIQAPTIMRAALKQGQVWQLGGDEVDVEHVHVEDLSGLYVLIAGKVVRDEAKGLVSGEEGIYFAATGKHTYGEFSKGVRDALVEVGGIKEGEVKRVGLKEAANEWTGGDELLCELNFGA
ncbi:MAG: hypothetical protein LQ352_004685 [Teloschistes flavicans]|nr:MAG: hypothetical protein LQ352_004685 [Teloschistes flavicans]